MYLFAEVKKEIDYSLTRETSYSWHMCCRTKMQLFMKSVSIEIFATLMVYKTFRFTISVCLYKDELPFEFNGRISAIFFHVFQDIQRFF